MWFLAHFFLSFRVAPSCVKGQAIQAFVLLRKLLFVEVTIVLLHLSRGLSCAWFLLNGLCALKHQGEHLLSTRSASGDKKSIVIILPMVTQIDVTARENVYA